MPENVEERQKRQKIEAALADSNTRLSKWQEFAKTEYGLVSGMFQAIPVLFVFSPQFLFVFFCWQMI